MNKFMLSLLLAFCLIPSFAQADSVERLWWATSATGGGSGSMDGAISGVSVNANDATFVVDSSKNAFIFKVNVDSAAEASTSNGIPLVVAPDDAGAGGTRYHLAKLYVKAIDFPSGATLPTLNYVNGGASTYFVYSGVTLTADMLAGGMIYVHTPLSGSTPTVLGVPTISGSTAFFMVKDMTGGGVTVQTTNAQTIYNDDDSGTAYWVNAGNSRHSATFKINSESGTCAYVDVLGEVGSNWLMN